MPMETQGVQKPNYPHPRSAILVNGWTFTQTSNASPLKKYVASPTTKNSSAQNNEENEGTPQCEGSNNTFDPNHLTTRSSQPTSHRKTNLHSRVTYSISLNVTTSLYDECTWTPSRKINYQEYHMAEKMRQIIIPNSHLSKNWSNKILSVINIYQYFIGIDSPDDREMMVAPFDGRTAATCQKLVRNLAEYPTIVGNFWRYQRQPGR